MVLLVTRQPFKFSFDDKLSGITGYGLDAGDIKVTNGTAGTLSAATYTPHTPPNPSATPPVNEVLESTVYTLEVTLTDKTKPVTVAVKADSVKDASGNNFELVTTGNDPTFTPDNTPPKLTISHTPADGELPTGTNHNLVTFKFSFDDALGNGDAALQKKDIKLGGNGTAGDLSAADHDCRW